MYSPEQPNPYSWTQAPQQPRKGWWGRNWKWFVPAGCLGVVLLLAGFVAAIVFVVFSAIKSNEVYRNAVEQARANQTVVQEMGEPIEEGWYVKGSVSESGGAGSASLEIPISGPRRAGMIYADAIRDAGEWKYTRLEVGIEGLAGRVQIFNPLLPPPLSGLEGLGGEAETTGTNTPAKSATPAAKGSTGAIGGGVLNGKATHLPQPTYPAVARAARASGTVVVQVTVDESGKVTEARAVSGHPLLQAAAVQAARQATFKPTLLSGRAVKVTGTLVFNFAGE